MRATTAILCLTALVAGSLASPANNDKCNPPSGEVGAVFALTNVAAENQVIAFSRDQSGKLTQTGQYSTGGRGQGVDFDTQGGLILSDNRRFLYAVNPADDKISVFSASGSCLNLIQVVDGGDQPLSITLNNGFAYVLDGSVATTQITGFRVSGDGTLQPLANSTKPLSSLIGAPGVIQFSPDGKAIIVTQKVGSSIDVFSVGSDGLATGPIAVAASSGPRPFGATFRNDGVLFVVESGLPSFMNAGLSTYQFDSSTGALAPITMSAKNRQTDGCWVILTKDDKFAYTANFVSGSIASYSVSPDGSVTLINGQAAFPGTTSNPVDLAMSDDGQFLYDLLRGTGGVEGWQIEQDGSINSLGVFGVGGGLPINNGASGLAAF
ncbi:hypothetical protein BJ546DRAFT_850211 [Cryomyces antarcticus]|uniref:3-carboxymuconate cyclase n=1 Tax=Cryomyces antarcticus TaxID=329879 RepID=A0ABR0M9I1_9PEZI|nr:hypothetical protein LTR60_001545 [Cryomyces antarcticus]KAK5291073.1 hypothetical protein LTR16_002346 [Cryomyces antarcticus]